MEQNKLGGIPVNYFMDFDNICGRKGAKSDANEPLNVIIVHPMVEHQIERVHLWKHEQEMSTCDRNVLDKPVARSLFQG